MWGLRTAETAKGVAFGLAALALFLALSAFSFRAITGR